MIFQENNNFHDHILRVRFWTRALIESEDEETVIYNISLKPRFDFYVIQGSEEKREIEEKISLAIPKRGSRNYKNKIFDATYRACLIEEPNLAAKNFSSDFYRIEGDTVIFKKSSFEDHNVIKPVFILRRDVRRCVKDMNSLQIKNLFKDKDSAVDHLEFMAILFGTEDEN